jgi:hypothetical protein
MSNNTIIVDPEKIREKIKWHDGEIKRLNGLLASLDSLQEFVGAASGGPDASPRLGRPPKSNPVEPILEKFIKSRNDEVTFQQIVEACRPWEKRKDLIGAAMTSLEKRGILEVVELAVGRRPGKYKKKGVEVF